MSKTRQGNWWILGVIGALLWVGASVIAAQLIVGWIMIMVVGKDNFDQPVYTAIYSAISYLLALGLVIIVPAKLKLGTKKKQAETKEISVKEVEETSRLSWRQELGLDGLLTWKDLGLAPVGYVVYFLLAALLTFLFMSFPWFDAEQVQDVGFNAFIAGGDKLIAFITLVVVAPVAEEILFRGWLYHQLRKQFSEHLSEKISMALAIFLVSLLFGIVHLQWNVGVNVFAMSVVLCGLREITGTIYSGIVLHMLKNGIAFYMLYGINI